MPSNNPPDRSHLVKTPITATSVKGNAYNTTRDKNPDKGLVTDETRKRAKASGGALQDVAGGEGDEPTLTADIKERLEQFPDWAMDSEMQSLGVMTSPHADEFHYQLDEGRKPSDAIVHALAISGEYDNVDELLQDAQLWSQSGATPQEALDAIVEFSPAKEGENKDVAGHWNGENIILENGVVVTNLFMDKPVSNIAARPSESGWTVEWISEDPEAHWQAEDYFSEGTVNGTLTSFDEIARKHRLSPGDDMTKHIDSLGEVGKDFFIVERYSHGLDHYSLAGTGSYPDRQWDVGQWGVYVPPSKEESGGWEPDEKAINSMLDEYSQYVNGEAYCHNTVEVDRSGKTDKDSHETIFGYSREGIVSESGGRLQLL